MNESKVEQDTLIVQCDTNNSKKKDVKNEGKTSFGTKMKNLFRRK